MQPRLRRPSMGALASKVVQPGKTFLRQLFELLKETQKGFHHIRLTVEARSDICWWTSFVKSCNRISLLRHFDKELIDHHIASDASGQFGYGGLWHSKFAGPRNTVSRRTLPWKIVLCYVNYSRS